MKLELVIDHDGIKAEICVTLTAPTSLMPLAQGQDDGLLNNEVSQLAIQSVAPQVLTELWQVHRIIGQALVAGSCAAILEESKIRHEVLKRVLTLDGEGNA